MRDERLRQGRKFWEVLKEGEEKQQKAERLKATKRRMALTARQFLKVYKPETIIAWRTFLVPTEIFYATGVLPFTPESACALLARNQPIVRKLIQRAEENQYEPKLCSFLKTIIGGVYEGIMPTPDIVVASPCFCSGIGSILRDVSSYYGSDFFYLEIPLEYNPEAVEYLANQLRKLTALLCEKTGMSISEVEKERLPRVIEFSNQAAKYWKQIEELRQTVPSPMSGREALDYATVLSQTWGCEEIVEIYKLLYSELKERVEKKIAAVPNETLRLFWLHLRPYYSDEIFEFIESRGAVIAFEEVNYPSRYEIDPHDPYRALAQEIFINAGQYRVFSSKWQRDMDYLLPSFKINGIIHFGHDNCEWIKATIPSFSNFLEKKREVPVLGLSGDCLIKERAELLKTRLQAFLEGLRTKQEVSIRDKIKSRCQISLQAMDKEYFMGIDVGAATTKVVILNSKEEILGWSIFSTGPDNRRTIERTLKEALKMAGDMKLEECKRIVATGVGRNNVTFANKEITEITCHIEGMKHFFPEVKTILDIGGQDTKAISVEETRFRMNDACAAGTGKFLEVIAHALGVNLEELAKLDAGARKTLAISRMCTVFAQSEVVNLIAKGCLMEEIIRGIHEMVADRVITLLHQLSTKITSPVAISGGVGINKGVIRAIEQRIGKELLVPDNPQIIGALGAAIIAAQMGLSSDLPKT